MANTLNLGDGNWATKEDSLLAYNSENNNYKPLPFDFSRGSSATRVNKDGLIETVGNNVPRIDYTDDSKGSLLLEPSRTNLITYSEDFSQWTDYNASAVLSEETIYGKNAYKIVEDNTVNYHGVYLSNLFTANGTNYIWSVYVKGAERRYVVLTARTGISSNASAIIFDTQEGEWVLDSSNQNEALSAESVGNGWWRIAIEGNPTSVVYDSFTIAASTGYSSYLDANYQGDGTSGFYVAMPQTEQGSYATSYIPTRGGVVTRLAESCNNGGNEQVINSTEGVLYAEISSFKNGGIGDRTISISDGSTQNAIQLLLHNTANRINFRLKSGGSLDVNISDFTFEQNQINKIACKYKSGDYALWINGEERVASSSSSLPTGLSVLAFDDGSLNYFYGNVKDVKLYNTALTDQELQALTTI